MTFLLINIMHYRRHWRNRRRHRRLIRLRYLRTWYWERTGYFYLFL